MSDDETVEYPLKHWVLFEEAAGRGPEALKIGCGQHVVAKWNVGTSEVHTEAGKVLKIATRRMDITCTGCIMAASREATRVLRGRTDEEED